MKFFVTGLLIIVGFVLGTAIALSQSIGILYLVASEAKTPPQAQKYSGKNTPEREGMQGLSGNDFTKNMMNFEALLRNSKKKTELFDKCVAQENKKSIALKNYGRCRPHLPKDKQNTNTALPNKKDGTGSVAFLKTIESCCFWIDFYKKGERDIINKAVCKHGFISMLFGGIVLSMVVSWVNLIHFMFRVNLVTLDRFKQWCIDAPPILGIVGTLFAMVVFFAQNSINPELWSAFFENFIIAATTTIFGGIANVSNLLLWNLCARYEDSSAS